jgi:hypothetical protein
VYAGRTLTVDERHPAVRLTRDHQALVQVRAMRLQDVFPAPQAPEERERAVDSGSSHARNRA